MIKDKWVKSDGLLAHYRDKKWTGLLIAKLTGRWAIPFNPITYHIMDNLRNIGIANSNTLKGAKAIGIDYINQL